MSAGTIERRVPAGLLSTHDVRRLSGLSVEKWDNLHKRYPIPRPCTRMGSLRRYTAEQAVLALAALAAIELGFPLRSTCFDFDDPRTYSRRIGPAVYAPDMRTIRAAVTSALLPAPEVAP